MKDHAAHESVAQVVPQPRKPTDVLLIDVTGRLDLDRGNAPSRAWRMTSTSRPSPWRKWRKSTRVSFQPCCFTSSPTTNVSSNGPAASAPKRRLRTEVLPKQPDGTPAAAASGIVDHFCELDRARQCRRVDDLPRHPGLICSRLASAQPGRHFAHRRGVRQ